MELTADEARKIKVPRRWKEVYDLLEKQREGARHLDFEYVQLNLDRLHGLLQRLYAKPRRW